MSNADGLTDREAAIDAVVRFVCALDEGSPELLVSSLTEDSVMDLTPFHKVGMKRGLVEGRTAIADLLMAAVGKSLDTTHSATNIRCTVQGDMAELTTCVLAQHFRKGQGPNPEFQEHYLFGNQYATRIVRDGAQWKIKKITITPAWVLGNPDVMNV